jgi:hypothetical protein
MVLVISPPRSLHALSSVGHISLSLTFVARRTAEDDDEDRMLLAIRKPEAAAASISSIEVTFGTGPALRTFDYSVKCVDFAATGESIIDGCDADPAGDGAVTGLTTRSASTITAQVTGLFPLVEYYCYVSVESEKASKCMPVGSVRIGIRAGIDFGRRVLACRPGSSRRSR